MSLFENKERLEELEKLLYFQSFGQNFRRMVENWSLSIKRSEMIDELVDGSRRSLNFCLITSELLVKVREIVKIERDEWWIDEKREQTELGEMLQRATFEKERCINEAKLFCYSSKLSEF